ncbi:MAG: flagellar motor protein MotB [Pleurocapsa sp.]
MTSSQAENFDSLSSDNEPIDNLLDILLDSESSQDSTFEEESELFSSSATLDICDRNTFTPEDTFSQNDLAEFEQLVKSKQLEKPPSPDNLKQHPHSELSEIEVEAEDKKDTTLEKAVEYKACIRQTVDSQEEQNSPLDLDDSSSIAQYEDVLAIKTESASTEELAQAVNTLIPLVVELLKYKIEDYQESILRGITPILEKIIEQRSEEEPQKMAAAIAKILPSAITENLNLSPEEIAKAIAPELALSIKEQIRLDENAISEALGSEMGKAIKTQIEVEIDAMVDALYPVIGDTISKYMVEVVQEINSKVENTLSPEGLRRKLQARLKGVSEAELILQESVGCHVQAVFLIDKDSGLIIKEVQQSGEQGLDSDLVVGMLTAIRSFANDCIVSGSELDSIDYGNWQIHLEVAGYCYLAVVVKGEPNKDFIARIRRTFGDIVLYHGEEIAKFEGNMETIPTAIETKLAKLIEPETKPEKKASSPTTLIWLLAFILAMILIPWGMASYRSRTAQNIEQITAIELDAAPELSVYRLEPTVEKGQLQVQGRVPSEYLRDRAAMIGKAIADKNNLEFNNQIITVDVPATPSLLAGEILRLTKLFNQQPGVSIKTNYDSRSLSIA